jgi:hypothetical protein
MRIPQTIVSVVIVTSCAHGRWWASFPSMMATAKSQRIPQMGYVRYVYLTNFLEPPQAEVPRTFYALG